MSDEPLKLDEPFMTAQAGRIQRKAAIESAWRIPWTDFEVMLGLRNPLHLRNMSIDTYERAGEFLRSCGFDLANLSHCRMFEQFYGESIYLIRHVVLTHEERQRLKVPPALLHLDDPRRLPLYASDRAPRTRYRRLWATAIVKVFNAITTLEYSDKLRDIEAAREQILGRVREFIHTAHDGSLWIRFKGSGVRLHAIDWKESKTRSSIILKLLHKPESVMDEVFDYLGVRFVVERECDLPQLLKLLVSADIIIPHQVLNLRTRNTLLSIQKAQKLLDILYSLSSVDRVEPEEFENLCAKIPWTFRPHEEVGRTRNAFSSSVYKSLQLTVRHLVRLPNPAHAVVDSLSQQVRHYRGMDRNDPSLSSVVPAEIAKYFPIEIQVMDASAYDLSKFGAASHEQYKAAQLNVVRERVLTDLLTFTDDRISTQEL